MMASKSKKDPFPKLTFEGIRIGEAEKRFAIAAIKSEDKRTEALTESAFPTGISKPPERVGCKLPPSEILYFKNGNIEKVIVNETDDSGFPQLSKYRKWGKEYFHYVEGHAVLMENRVPYDKLPLEIRTVFDAKTKEGVAKLRKQGKLENYVD